MTWMGSPLTGDETVDKDILLDAVAATSSVIADVLFLRSWRETVDRLLSTTEETRAFVFVPRLAGFVLTLAAIVGRTVDEPASWLV